MAIANFFDKAALNAAQVLNNFDRNEFHSLLNRQVIGIFFDKNAYESKEGIATLDLLVRLLARLYPKLRFISADLHGNNCKSQLTELAKQINPEIEISDLFLPNATVIIGQSLPLNLDDGARFFVGSDRWITHFSQQNPVGSGKSNNPIGAGAAACFATANVFRFVFGNQLPKGTCDGEFSLSFYNYSQSQPLQGPEIEDIILTPTVTVGLGAIGNGLLWTLLNCEGIKGDIEIIDDQEITLSNLQRYVLATQNDVNKSKVEHIAAHFDNHQLKVIPIKNVWQKYIADRSSHIERVATCLDTAADRIKVQASLPKKLFNAWTQPQAIGISRHVDFINGPCMVCMYIPDQPKKPISVIIAESLKLLHEEEKIRSYIAQSKPVDQELFSMICLANNITEQNLIQFLGQPVEAFYQGVICGGIMFRLNGSPEAKEVEVPAAFESALAGIMLAAELIFDDLGEREISFPTITRINMMRPLPKHLLELQNKHHTGECICQDEIYLDVYSEKWKVNSSIVV